MKVKHTRRLYTQEHRALVFWAADCAEHVLSRFEEKHPNDHRPRQAIAAGRTWAWGEITMREARAAAFAAHAAARDSEDAAACAAARAAGHAAATAHVSSHAYHAAAYAVTAAGPTSAATERDWQGRRLPGYLQPGLFPAQAGTTARRA